MLTGEREVEGRLKLSAGGQDLHEGFGSNDNISPIFPYQNAKVLAALLRS